MHYLLRKGTKQKNGVCVSADKFNLDVLNLRKERKDFTEGGYSQHEKKKKCCQSQVLPDDVFAFIYENNSFEIFQELQKTGISQTKLFIRRQRRRQIKLFLEHEAMVTMYNSLMRFRFKAAQV